MPEIWQYNDGFRLIDCEERQLVARTGIDLRNISYIAFSYVWGNVAGDEAEQATLPGRLPQTIEDAMQVTVRLGFRYLWCDRYCIRQQHASEKQQQISAMAQIYGAAVLTIVAAAGIDPSHGLPGVRSRRVARQPGIQIGEFQFLGSFASPAKDILASKWMSRGWTYQEGEISRRRLVFTDKQAYFQCRQCFAWESKPRLESLFRITTSAFPDRGHGQFDLVARIKEYTGRQLSYDTDILNAFGGILKLHAACDESIVTLWGSPIFMRHWNQRDALSDRENLTKGLFRGINWIPDDYNHDQLIERRDYFPTWCWAGWRVQVDYPFKGNDLVLGGSSVSITLVDGTPLELSQLYHGLKQGHVNPDHISPSVELSCWTIPITTIFYDGLRKINLNIFGTTLYADPITMTNDCDFDQDELLGIILGRYDGGCTPHAIIVRKCHDHWERVGHFFLNQLTKEHCKNCSSYRSSRTCPSSGSCLTITLVKRTIILR